MKIILGNSLEKLKELEDNSIDSIVTDPPYELGFMGKKWDNTGIANNVDLWAECLRVIKPGGHLLAFSGTRTYHRMAVAIEDAGFEVRDMIEWVYGSGFPKSLNIGKAVDKFQGNERKVVKTIDINHLERGDKNILQQNYVRDVGVFNFENEKRNKKDNYTTKGTSEWEGWGTALKPSHEPICMARKPLAEKTVAENVLKWGTGGINIDESRVEMIDREAYEAKQRTFKGATGKVGEASWKNSSPLNDPETSIENSKLGRFPANLIHDGSPEVEAVFPQVKGKKPFKKLTRYNFGVSDNNSGQKYESQAGLGEIGSASRFFKSIIYNPKASKAERNKGCEELEEKQYSHDGRKKEIENAFQRNKSVATNNHPTVKPIALMEYLIKMVTPKGGIVLDPFMGSGSTGVAAKKNGYDFIGIDMTPEYIEIAKARINATEIENRLI